MIIRIVLRFLANSDSTYNGSRIFELFCGKCRNLEFDVELHTTVLQLQRVIELIFQQDSARSYPAISFYIFLVDKKVVSSFERAYFPSIFLKGEIASIGL